MIDPTIRFERDEAQANDVHQEKVGIYEPCISNIMQQYSLNSVEIIGLLIGARETIYKQFEDLRRRFNLCSKLRDGVALHAIKSSIRIFNSHLS